MVISKGDEILEEFLLGSKQQKYCLLVCVDSIDKCAVQRKTAKVFSLRVIYLSFRHESYYWYDVFYTVELNPFCLKGTSTPLLLLGGELQSLF